MQFFSAKIYKIGINPYVLLPPVLLEAVLKDAGKDKGPIPVRLSIENKIFLQTLVKYSGKWRLYLNGPMRVAAGKDVGDIIAIGIAFDPGERLTETHPALAAALKKNSNAKAVFDSLPPSLQKEIRRYINNLKTTAAVERNVEKAIQFLLGKERFIGREKP